MEIDSKAKKCPYCHHWQNKWFMIAYHPFCHMIPGILIFIALFCFLGKMFQTTFTEGESFLQYTNAVSIIEAEMVFGVSGCEHDSPTVAVIGIIQNDSDVPWKDINLEVRYFDKQGFLMDTMQREMYSYMVHSNDNGAFKVSSRREFPQENYDSFKVRIISAKDARKRF